MAQRETVPETLPLNLDFKGPAGAPADPSKWKIMGLDPSPELLAIAMGTAAIVYDAIRKRIHCFLMWPCMPAIGFASQIPAAPS